MDHIFLTHSSVSGPLRCLCKLAAVNNAAFTWGARIASGYWFHLLCIYSQTWEWARRFSSHSAFTEPRGCRPCTCYELLLLDTYQPKSLHTQREESLSDIAGLSPTALLCFGLWNQGREAFTVKILQSFPVSFHGTNEGTFLLGTSAMTPTPFVICTSPSLVVEPTFLQLWANSKRATVGWVFPPHPRRHSGHRLTLLSSSCVPAQKEIRLFSKESRLWGEMKWNVKLMLIFIDSPRYLGKSAWNTGTEQYWFRMCARQDGPWHA